VKHSVEQYVLVKDLFDQLNINADEKQIHLITEHTAFVLEWNSSINLTAIKNFEDALTLHIEDSIRLIKFLNNAPAGKYLDMGTGGGYPGIELGILSGRECVLLDSTNKKIELLKCFCIENDIEGITPFAARIEEYAIDHAQEFSAITARALSSLPVLIELATPLLSYGGQLIATKAQCDESELKAAEKAANICGMELIKAESFSLTGDVKRTVYIYKRVSEPQIKLPRRVGKAQKNPLC
jgi:16S rRNA (guanine527-N7)-methyltransferase